MEFTREGLYLILNSPKPLWLVRADLSGADLRWANLHKANLIRSNLSEADLRWASIGGADLSGADLSRANMRGAKLRGAVLYWAFLTQTSLLEADLEGAYMISARLDGARLRGASLIGANLSRANLRGADLAGANLRGASLTEAGLHAADLSGADLHGANLRGAILLDALLAGADLSGADLVGAGISDEQLNQVGSMVGATLPDGTKYAGSAPGEEDPPAGTDGAEPQAATEAPIVTEPFNGLSPADGVARSDDPHAERVPDLGPPTAQQDGAAPIDERSALRPRPVVSAALAEKPLGAVVTTRGAAQYFSSVARDGDIALAPLEQSKVLRHVQRGRRGTIITSLRDLERRGDVAAQYDIIVYNPENRKESRFQEELEHLEEATRSVQQWAHQRGLEYVVSPGRRISVAMADKLAPFADRFNIQTGKRQQQDAGEFERHVRSVAALVQSGNSGIPMSSQVVTLDGSEHLYTLFASVVDVTTLMGVWVTPDGLDVFRELVDLIR